MSGTIRPARRSARRLERLEIHSAAHPGGIDPAICSPWMPTVSDTEIVLLAGVVGYLEVSSDPADLGAEVCEGLARIIGP